MIAKIATIGVIMLIIGLLADPVTELPWGLQQPLEVFANMFNVIANTMPWMATVLNVILIGMFVKIALWVFDKTLIIIGWFS